MVSYGLIPIIRCILGVIEMQIPLCAMAHVSKYFGVGRHCGQHSYNNCGGMVVKVVLSKSNSLNNLDNVRMNLVILV